MVTKRKHKKALCNFNSTPYESHLPQLNPQMGGPNGLHSVQRKNSIFGHVKNFYRFVHFSQKAYKNLGKNLFRSCAHK